MRTSAAGNNAMAPALARASAWVNRCSRGNRGFTLLELLVVIAIMAMATAGVTLTLRDSADTALEREAQRLAVLFESARAQSRATGVPVQWHTTPTGFRFEGLPAEALPNRWLAEGTAVRGSTTVQLGPEPIIGPQAVELVSLNQPTNQSSNSSGNQANRAMRIATDGLRPFAVQSIGQP